MRAVARERVRMQTHRIPRKLLVYGKEEFGSIFDCAKERRPSAPTRHFKGRRKPGLQIAGRNYPVPQVRGTGGTPTNGQVND